MIKKVFLIILINIVLISNTGCWGKRELSEIGLVTATGIDLDPNGEIRITVISITPIGFGMTGGPDRSNAWIGTGTGKTFADARRNLNHKATKKLAWFHNRFIIIGEDLAKNGITDVMDHLSRNREFRYENRILITPHTAYDMLTIPADIEKNLVLEIDGIIDNIKVEWSKSYIENFKDIMVNLIEEKSGFVTSKISYYKTDKTTISTNREDYKTIESGGKDQDVAFIEGSGVFREDKLVGWLDGTETRSYILISSKVMSGTISAKYNDQKDSLSFAFEDSKSNIRAEFNDNNITINIDLQVIGIITGLYTGQNIRKEEEINKMEQAISKKIENELRQTVSKAQKELKTDFLGFGDHIFRRHPNHWRKFGDSWDEIFPTIDVNYNVEVNIKRTGMISNPTR
ncbi:UNVERIFIED_CONTAM: spore germination protein KC [Acetivibrio alkalicellulosi]